MKLENENINVFYIYDCIESLKFKVIWHMANMIAKIFFSICKKAIGLFRLLQVNTDRHNQESLVVSVHWTLFLPQPDLNGVKCIRLM